MPSGAKKRKALKKKQQQESIGTSTNNNTKVFNGDNLHGNDEHGSLDDRESDSNLSSPGSQGNDEFGTKDPSAALSSGLVKDSAKEVAEDADVTQGLGSKNGNAIAVERGGKDYQKITVGKSHNSSSENCTHTAENVDSQDASVLVKGGVKEISGGLDVTQGLGPKSGNAIAVERGTDYQKNVVEKSPQTAKNGASQDACGKSVLETSPVVDSVKHVVSVSKVVIFEKSEHVEASTQSNLVKQKSDVIEENPSVALKKDNSKVVTLPVTAAETSKKVEIVRESEVPVSSEEKRLLLPGPPAEQTSWLSCCGLFDAMTGSDR